jgi:CheY-like chemotaxis protein
MMHPEQEQPNIPSSAQRRHILVVDDDPLFRSLMVGVLRRDFQITVATDGADGFYRALDHKPDVTVLDLQMPGWDGLKTLRAFRAHPKLADVKVMVLTSDSSRETVLAAIHAGADDYTIKTAFSRDEFRQKLDRLCRQPRSMDCVIDEAMNSVDAPDCESIHDEPHELLAVDTRHISWSGSNDLLQEAIDAWE